MKLRLSTLLLCLALSSGCRSPWRVRILDIRDSPYIASHTPTNATWLATSDLGSLARWLASREITLFEGEGGCDREHKE